MPNSVAAAPRSDRRAQPEGVRHSSPGWMRIFVDAREKPTLIGSAVFCDLLGRLVWRAALALCGTRSIVLALIRPLAHVRR
jgi:hypothetical protein